MCEGFRKLRCSYNRQPMFPTRLQCNMSRRDQEKGSALQKKIHGVAISNLACNRVKYRFSAFYEKNSDPVDSKVSRPSGDSHPNVFYSRYSRLNVRKFQYYQMQGPRESTGDPGGLPGGSGVPRNFFGGGSTNSVEDRENGDLGDGSPLVRGSGGSCNLVQEISFHMVKFS